MSQRWPYGAGFNPLSLFAGGEAGLLFDPTDRSTLFKDAALADPVTTVADLVYTMKDKSPNANHATQTVSGRRPAYGVDSLGGYIQADGVDDFMEVVGSDSKFKFMHDGTGATILAAFTFTSPLTPSKNYPLVASATGAAVGFTLNFGEAVAGNIATQQQYTTIANGSATVINGTSGGQGSIRGDGLGQVAGFTYKTQPGSDFFMNCDGNNFNLGRAESTTPSSANSFGLIRLFNSHTANYAPAKLRALFIINRELTASERRNMINWLRGRYGDDRHILGVGDSHTYNTAYGVYMRGYYPALMEASMRSAGYRTASLNYGVSGNTTTQIIARMASVLEHGAPYLAVVYAGQNDVAVDTTANLVTIVNQIKAAGCSRILVAGAHYMNFSSGGDTTSAEEAGWSALRDKQEDAAVAAGVPYVDLYTYMRALIVGGTYTQGDAAWHVADGNTHLNAAGEQILANAMLAAAQVQGWI